MGPGRLELPTSRLSGVRSSQLSYEPDSTAKTWHSTEVPGGRLSDSFTYFNSKEQ